MGSHTTPPQSWTDPEEPRLRFRVSARARRVSLRARPAERCVEVVVPGGGAGALRAAQDFARAQRPWIRAQLEALPPARPLAPGAQVPVRGELYGLGNPGGRGRPRIDHAGRRILVPAPAGTFAGRALRLLKREAKAELTARTDHFAALIDREVAKVSVRDTASRWGSSVTRGRGADAHTHISYSWRLFCAPPWVLDYVCAHEVAHILHPDHSPRFWAACHSLFPDTPAAKRWLSRHGAGLHAVGAEA